MPSDFANTIPYILSNIGNANNFSASATQSQGNGLISVGFTRVNVVATELDAITLPTAEKGISCIIHNTDAGQTIQCFPNVDDKIDSLAVNLPILIRPQQIVWLWAIDAINWASFGLNNRGAKSYTASGTQTQAGGTAITTEIADVSTISSDRDAVTIFPAFYGAKCFVKNSDLGQELQIFPAVGHRFDALANDQPILLGAGSSVLLSAVSNAKWLTHAVRISSKDGFNASVTQTQGQGQLSQGFTRISVIGTDGDVVTLPLADKGKECVLENGDVGQYCQVFPASGDAIDGMTVNLPLLLFPGQTVIFRGTDTTNWRTDWKSRMPSTRTGITATGNIISTATQLIGDWNSIATSTATDNAVQLPLGYAGRKVWIHNDDNADAVLVFPKSGASAQIDDNAVDASISLAVNATIELRAISPTKWRSNIT